MSNLLGRLSDPKAIFRAWEVVKKNKNVAVGVDEMSVLAFQQSEKIHLATIVKQLKSKSYQFQPSRRKAIPKGAGKKGTRNIHIFTVRDKIVQQALARLFLSTSPEKALFPEVYNSVAVAYLPRTNGVKVSVDRVKQNYKDGHKYLCSLDVKDFFDNISGDELLKKITSRLPDNSLNWLIENTIKQEVYILDKNDVVSQVLQGSVLAPLYSNIYLAEFDRAVEQNKIQALRYADDVAIFAKTSEEAKLHRAKLHKLLKEKTGLDFYPDDDKKKGSKIMSFGQYASFLGIRYSKSNKGYLKIEPAPDKVSSQKAKIDEFFANETYSIAENIFRTNLSIKSWYSHYTACGCHQSLIRPAVHDIFSHYYAATCSILVNSGITNKTVLTLNQLHTLGVMRPSVLKRKKVSISTQPSLAKDVK